MGPQKPPTTQLRAIRDQILTTFEPLLTKKYVRNRLAETRRLRYVSRESDKYLLKKL